MPLTLPEPSTVATDVLLLLQVPAPTLAERLIVWPAHRLDGPLIDGSVLTVMGFLDVQPVAGIV